MIFRRPIPSSDSNLVTDVRPSAGGNQPAAAAGGSSRSTHTTNRPWPSEQALGHKINDPVRMDLHRPRHTHTQPIYDDNVRLEDTPSTPELKPSRKEPHTLLAKEAVRINTGGVCPPGKGKMPRYLYTGWGATKRGTSPQHLTRPRQTLPPCLQQCRTLNNAKSPLYPSRSLLLIVVYFV